MAINTGRVVAGGAVAGVAYNVRTLSATRIALTLTVAGSLGCWMAKTSPLQGGLDLRVAPGFAVGPPAA
jgi:hypothetical protein